MGYSLEFVAVFLCVANAAAQMAGARSEYFTGFAVNYGDTGWYIHHDEKLIIPDAKFYLLRSKKNITLSDFVSYPVSGAFGIAGPLLAFSGFRLFGLNNTGLRAFFILISACANLFSVLTLLKLFPGLPGALFSLLYLLNFNNFLLNRHAIVEHILTCFLSGIFYLYAADPVFFLEHINVIALLSASCILAKHYFILYVFMLIFIIALIERIGSRGLSELLLSCIAGTMMFELLQLGFLQKLGIADGRYATVLRGVRQASGRWTSLTGHMRPAGKKVFMQYWSNFVIFFSVSRTDLSSKAWLRNPLFPLLFLCGTLSLYLSGGAPKPYWVALFFAVCYLASMWPSCYYFKRGFSLFPFTIIITASVFHTAFSWTLSRYPELHWLSACLFIVPFAALVVLQIKMTLSARKLRSKGVENNSLMLDSSLPEGSTVYAHCYGYRFFWQARKQRLMSADDTVMSNQMVIDWAIKDHAKYVLVSGLGGEINSETAALINPLKYFETTASESDVPQKFMLGELLI